MTSFFMSLLTNDYGIISRWMIMIVSILFILSFLSIDENPIVAGLSCVLALFLLYGLIVVAPAKIPEYGTEAQKAKMAYCVQQHTQSNKVGLESVTHDNIESIMKQCHDQDAQNKPIEEQNLKNKDLQDSIRKINNTNK